MRIWATRKMTMPEITPATAVGVTATAKILGVELTAQGDALLAQGISNLTPRTKKEVSDVDNKRPSSSETRTGNWNKGSYDSPKESLEDHFARHGQEVGTDTVEQYLNKAENFSKNLKGARTKAIDGFTEGVTRYYKNGKYIDLAPDGSIISFGAQ